MEDPPRAVPGPIQGPDEIRDVLAHLSRELCRPVLSLRERFDRLLGDEEHPVSDAQRGQIGAMIGVCENLLELTRGYLDFAERSRGVVPPSEPDPFRLSDFAAEIDGRFAPKAADRRVAWDCSIEGGDAVVRSDRQACLQAVGHLASNALDYTPEGGAVRVVVSDGGGSAGSWSMAVSDDGPGIPAEDRDRVFEPFYRLDREVRSGSEGNGLGLALARVLVEGLGGSIAIDPSTTLGTRVVIRLPGTGPMPEAQ